MKLRGAAWSSNSLRVSRKNWEKRAVLGNMATGELRKFFAWTNSHVVPWSLVRSGRAIQKLTRGKSAELLELDSLLKSWLRIANQELVRPSTGARNAYGFRVHRPQRTERVAEPCPGRNEQLSILFQRNERHNAN